MKYLSVCSGIEAATVAWKPLGWQPVGFAEIEKFPCQVLAHRYGSNMPGEKLSHNAPPNLGDINNYMDWPDADFDVLVGGTPCQTFSVAGLRAGMADPRGNLALVYCGIADRYSPQWFVWENVPGVLSSNGGRDFGSFLGAMARIGYGVAYRVLDAQYVRVDGFGRAVPQRRRRVIVVGYRGDWRRAAAVLFDREALSQDHRPSRIEWSDHPANAVSCATDDGRSTVAISFQTRFARNGRGGPEAICPTLNGSDAGATSDMRPCVAVLSFKPSHYTRGKDGAPSSIVPPLSADADKGDQDPVVMVRADVRRLTERECERLQGFPDDYTDIPGATGTPRYQSLGNTMAVNKMRWLGMRIEKIAELSLALPPHDGGGQ